MRRTIMALALALTMGGAGTAAAHDASFRTASSFGFFAGSPDAFLGDVSSPSRDCEVDRKVKVFLKKPGRDQLIGADRSDAGGQWLIETANAASAKYYAKIAERKLASTAAHDHVCRQYRSSTLPFG